jgi:hypothetical protein
MTDLSAMSNLAKRHAALRVQRRQPLQTFALQARIGQRLPTPLILVPVGVLEMAHARAHLAAAKAAAAERVPFIFSNQASVPMEPCAAAMGAGIRWFQLYWSTDDRLVISFLRRAEACSCRALVLTLDTTLLGWRPKDLDRRYVQSACAWSLGDLPRASVRLWSGHRRGTGCSGGDSKHAGGI